MNHHHHYMRITKSSTTRVPFGKDQLKEKQLAIPSAKMVVMVRSNLCLLIITVKMGLIRSLQQIRDVGG